MSGRHTRTALPGNYKKGCTGGRQPDRRRTGARTSEALCEHFAKHLAMHAATTPMLRSFLLAVVVCVCACVSGAAVHMCPTLQELGCGVAGVTHRGRVHALHGRMGGVHARWRARFARAGWHWGCAACTLGLG